MASKKFIKIRTFMTSTDRDKQILDKSKVFPEEITLATELTERMLKAREDQTHQFVSFYNEDNQLIKDYPAAARYLDGEEGLYGLYS